jgi:hypothetical protein
VVVAFARKGAAPVVRWLVRHGADPAATNKRGQTPASVASDPAVVRALAAGRS